MKIAGRDIAALVAKPGTKYSAFLIYGQDPMRVAIRRKALLTALVGPEAETEMRLTLVQGPDLRKDASLALDAVKAVGFFPGARAIHIENAAETCNAGILQCLEDWQDGDATLVVTAGALKPTSKIRKAFEAGSTTACLAIYNDPPSAAEVSAIVAKSGIQNLDKDAEVALGAFSRELDPGDFGQFVEKLALYTLNKSEPVSIEDIVACAPMSTEAAVDDILNIVAEARTSELTRIFQKLAAQGVSPTALCINALRHFKTLHAAASHPQGVSQGMSKLRPPVFGPRRDRMQRQAQSWGSAKLEQAIGLLLETDLGLRSAGQTAPQMAVVERCLIRLSMLGKS